MPGKKFRVDISGYQSRADRVANNADEQNYDEEEEEEEEVIDKGELGGGGGGGEELKVDTEASEIAPSASAAAPPSGLVVVAEAVDPPVTATVVDNEVEVEEVDVEVEEVVEGDQEAENEDTAEAGEEDSQEEENDDTSRADSDNQQEPEEKPIEAPVMPVMPPRKTQGYGLGKGLALGFPKIREVIEVDGEAEAAPLSVHVQPEINPYAFTYSSQISDSLYTSHMPASRTQDQVYNPGVGQGQGQGYIKGFGDPHGYAPGGGDVVQNMGYTPWPGEGLQILGYTQGQGQGPGPGPGQPQGPGPGQGQGQGSMES